VRGQAASQCFRVNAGAKRSPEPSATARFGLKNIEIFENIDGVRETILRAVRGG
jgi:hypothetical protein